MILKHKIEKIVFEINNIANSEAYIRAAGKLSLISRIKSEILKISGTESQKISTGKKAYFYADILEEYRKKVDDIKNKNSDISKEFDPKFEIANLETKILELHHIELIDQEIKITNLKLFILAFNRSKKIFKLLSKDNFVAENEKDRDIKIKNHYIFIDIIFQSFKKICSFFSKILSNHKGNESKKKNKIKNFYKLIKKICGKFSKIFRKTAIFSDEINFDYKKDKYEKKITAKNRHKFIKSLKMIFELRKRNTSLSEETYYCYNKFLEKNEEFEKFEIFWSQKIPEKSGMEIYLEDIDHILDIFRKELLNLLEIRQRTIDSYNKIINNIKSFNNEIKISLEHITLKSSDDYIVKIQENSPMNKIIIDKETLETWEEISEIFSDIDERDPDVEKKMTEIGKILEPLLPSKYDSNNGIIFKNKKKYVITKNKERF